MSGQFRDGNAATQPPPGVGIKLAQMVGAVKGEGVRRVVSAAERSLMM